MSPRTWTFWIATSLLCCWFPSQLHAEISPLPKLKGFGWKKALPLHLLGTPAVCKDVGLTDAVRQQIQDYQAKLESDAKTDASLKGSIHSKVEAKWAELLTPEQIARLHQIHLQSASLLNILSDAAVLEELGGLTDKQKESLHEAHKRHHIIQESFPNKLRNGPKPYTPEERRQLIADRMQQNDLELERKLVDLMTPEQREMLEKLKGQPFEDSGDRTAIEKP
ncbi:MAG: hypothetical protein ACK5OB_05390 [Pirellula sp.]